MLTAVATALANSGLAYPELAHTVLAHSVLAHSVLAHAGQAGTGLARTGLGRAALSGGTQPQLPGFLNSLSGPLTHYGLWAIALLVLIEDFGIPVPGETVLIAGAVYAGSGQLNVVAVGVVAFIAAVVGDNIGYAIGRWGGRALVLRWGKYVFITPTRLEHAEHFFESHGGKIITIARFIDGLRQANGLIAGITHMHWLKFAAFNALGAALWVGTWVSVGYFAGQHITTIYDDITSYSLYAAIAIVVLIAALVLFRLRRRRKKAAAALLALPAEDEQAARAEQAEAGPAEDAVPAEDAGPIGDTGPTEDTGPTGDIGPTERQAGSSANGQAEINGQAGVNGEAGGNGEAGVNGQPRLNAQAEANGQAGLNGQAGRQAQDSDWS